MSFWRFKNGDNGFKYVIVVVGLYGRCEVGVYLFESIVICLFYMGVRIL